MVINKIVLGKLQTNCYFIENNGEVVIIDPANEFVKIHEFIKENNFKVKAILVTHGHFDHVGAVKRLQKLNIPVYMSEFDSNIIENTPGYYFLERTKSFRADYFVKNGDELNLIGLKFKVLETPGHTKGSVSYKLDNYLFSGDLIFAGGNYGRIDLYSGNLQDLRYSLKDVLFKLDDDVVILAGHGKETRIKDEKELFIDF